MGKFLQFDWLLQDHKTPGGCVVKADNCVLLITYTEVAATLAVGRMCSTAF